MTFLTISLGTACNLNCKYCIQHQHVHSIINNKNINDDIYTFILNYIKNDDGEIIFYGGEPLLYWEQIKIIINTLKKNNYNFKIVTNGKLLTQDKIDFINANNITICLSYDGIDSIKSRQFDVYKENKNLILQINNLIVYCTISSYTNLTNVFKSIDDLNNDYFNLNNKNILYPKFNFVKCDMENDCEYKDYDDLQIQIKSIINDYINNSLTFAKWHFINKYLDLLKNINNQDIKPSICEFENDNYELSIDTAGNVLYCSNNPVTSIFGTIYDDIDVLFKKRLQLILKQNKNNIKFNDENCKICTYKSICPSPCYISSYNRRTNQCNIITTIFTTLIKTLMELNI